MKEIRVFNRTAHRELWEWRAAHLTASAADWPGWYDLGVTREEAMDFYSCMACACTGMTNTWKQQFMTVNGMDYTDTLQAMRTEKCCHCPLDWGYASDGHRLACWDGETLYSDFESAYSFAELEDIALMIRDLRVWDDPEFVTIVK